MIYSMSKFIDNHNNGDNNCHNDNGHNINNDVSNNADNNVTNDNTTNSINKLTLELFMNKTMYQKYISKTDPKKHTELQIYLENVNLYKQQIIDLTIELLEDPTKQINNAIDDAFKHFANTMINHLKQKELENHNEYNQKDTDNIMFGNVTDFSQPKMQSFWGKNKVVKRDN